MKIVLKHLTKKFPNRNKKIGGEVIAVSDFDFEIPDGKLVGLLGPSGCGKSTALNLICGLETPTEGQIFFEETDVTPLPPEKRGVGLVFQSYALYPHLTVFKNIRFPLENLRGDAKLTKEEMDKRVMDAAKLVQIDMLLERKPNELSGGQQQRVAIARALVKMPDVLLLDEPLSNLDARLRLQTREEIRRIQMATGITTLFVTHDQDEAMSISDIIIVMKEGVVQQIDKPQQVYDNPVNLFVAKFLGTPPINVFEGKIIDGAVYIGDDQILARGVAPANGMDTTAGGKSTVEGSTDRPVYVGIRPEGFIIDENGPFKCSVERTEVMGRDVSVITKHDGCINDTGLIRSIIDADLARGLSVGETVNFSLKPGKVFIFDHESETRIDNSRISKEVQEV